MATPYSRFFDQMQAVVDSVNHDSEPAHRLANIQRLNKDFRRIIIQARDEAAYDVRVRYSSQDASILSGVERKYLDYWVHRWIKKNNLPLLGKRRRVDLSNVMDLSGE